MKHHFADLLDREGDYWTIVPNVERYSYSADEEIDKKELVKVITLNKFDKAWKQVFELPNLEEVTLHEPSKEQVESIGALRQLKRLRLSHFRPKNIGFLGELVNLEEIVFEYVSGFSDLSLMRKLPKLKSLHLENLRRVSNFDGLKGIESLKYLHIDGTLDWNQPIGNFNFLEGLPNLEVLALGFVTNTSDYPAFLPAIHLSKLKQLKIGLGTLKLEEYAFLEMAFPDGICGSHGTKGWEACSDFGEYFQPLGKGSRIFSKNGAKSQDKCRKLEEEYENLKRIAQEFIKQIRTESSSDNSKNRSGI